MHAKNTMDGEKYRAEDFSEWKWSLACFCLLAPSSLLRVALSRRRS